MATIGASDTHVRRECMPDRQSVSDFEWVVKCRLCVCACAICHSTELLSVCLSVCVWRWQEEFEVRVMRQMNNTAISLLREVTSAHGPQLAAAAQLYLSQVHMSCRTCHRYTSCTCHRYTCRTGTLTVVCVQVPTSAVHFPTHVKWNKIVLQHH